MGELGEMAWPHRLLVMLELIRRGWSFLCRVHGWVMVQPLTALPALLWQVLEDPEGGIPTGSESLQSVTFQPRDPPGCSYQLVPGLQRAWVPFIYG